MSISALKKTTFQIEVRPPWEVCKARKAEKQFREQKTQILTSGREKIVCSHYDLALSPRLARPAPRFQRGRRLHRRLAPQEDP